MNKNIPPFFKAHNFSVFSDSEKSILSSVVRNAGITQTEIIKNSGLTQQSVSRIVKLLLAKEALISERVSSGKPGQPGIAVYPAKDFAFTFGIAIMTDAFSIVLMDFSGQIVDQTTVSMPDMSRHKVINEIKVLFKVLLSKHDIPNSKVLGIGIGISGYCLGGHGRYNTPEALDDWALIELDDILSEEFNLPVFVENDGNAAAIGESLVGLGRQYANFAYLYIAGGLGGGIILNNNLMPGFHGNGGELGLILPRDEYHNPSMELLYQYLSEDGIKLDNISDMLQCFDMQWAGVKKWLEYSQKPFSNIISALAAILDTQAIVFGGRIPKTLAKEIIPAIEVYDNTRRSEPRPLPRLLVSEIEGDACAIGAATFAFNHYFLNS